MTRFDGMSQERPSVFKAPRNLSTHLSTQCSGDERQSRPCTAQPVNITNTSGVEARYTITRPYLRKNKT
ncbi:hypothetical protein TNCV_1448151 [Trichonephila clavipes]|nr:hypothetical protein TNCV_1448151 [Trichonephila clavipes]